MADDDSMQVDVDVDDSVRQKLVQRRTLKSARLQCWAARDAFFTCLDDYVAREAAQVGHKGSVHTLPLKTMHLLEKEAVKSECRQLRKLFASTCPASWERHFIDGRIQKQRNVRQQLRQRHR
jgi:Cytochrome oxidase c subunit VIb